VKNVDKIVNSYTRVKVVQTVLTQNIASWTHKTIVTVICASKKCQKSKLCYTSVTLSAAIYVTGLDRYNMISKCIRISGVTCYRNIFFQPQHRLGTKFSFVSVSSVKQTSMEKLKTIGMTAENYTANCAILPQG
jgi:hypothetical protein